MIALLLMMSPSLAADPEGERLLDEFTRYVKDGKWVAVERTYARLVAGHPDSLNNAVHQSASRAARQRGDMLKAAQRLLRCNPSGLALDTIADDLESLETGHGMTMLVGSKLEPATMPFAPDQRNAVQLAQKQVEEDGHFVGLLPAGTYRLDGKEVQVVAGFQWTDAWTR